jgi:hypothetical protein
MGPRDASAVALTGSAVVEDTEVILGVLGVDGSLVRDRFFELVASFSTGFMAAISVDCCFGAGITFGECTWRSSVIGDTST